MNSLKLLTLFLEYKICGTYPFSTDGQLETAGGLIKPKIRDSTGQLSLVLNTFRRYDEAINAAEKSIESPTAAFASS